MQCHVEQITRIINHLQFIKAICKDKYGHPKILHHKSSVNVKRVDFDDWFYMHEFTFFSGFTILGLYNDPYNKLRALESEPKQRDTAKSEKSRAWRATQFMNTAHENVVIFVRKWSSRKFAEPCALKDPEQVAFCCERQLIIREFGKRTHYKRQM